MNISTNLVNELLPDLSDDASCVVVGAVARDLFDCTSTVGHRTYFYGGHYWTGVEAYDGAEVCSDDCLTKWAAAHMHGAVELLTDVEQMWESYTVRTFLLTGEPEDGHDAVDAVAYPFEYSDGRFHDSPVVCASCGRIIIADESFRAYVETAFGQYLETALWSSLDWTTTGDDGQYLPEPLDDRFGVEDVSDDLRSELLVDVVEFIGAYWDDLRDLDAGQTGHDFWLTHNGHGTGFWDRGLGEVGDRLTTACRPYGEVDLYVGDDGDLYV